MKGLVFFIFALCLTGYCRAQKIILQNKSDLYFSVGTNIPMGPKDYGIGNPALLSNMGAGRVLDIQYVQSAWRGIRLGATVSQSDFSGWSHPDGVNTYTGTTVRIRSAGAVIMLKSRPQTIRSFQKIGCFLSVIPGIHQINTKTSPDSEINNTFPPLPLTIQSTRFGVRYNAGLDFTASTAMGISLSVGYQNIATDSKIYQEKNFSYLNIKAGVFYRFLKDRKYRYSNL